MGQIDLLAVFGVSLLKVLGLDRQEGDLELVLAEGRLYGYICVWVGGEVQQKFRVGEGFEFYFHVATVSIQILYSCIFKLVVWTSGLANRLPGENSTKLWVTPTSLLNGTAAGTSCTRRATRSTTKISHSKLASKKELKCSRHRNCYWRSTTKVRSCQYP